VKSELIKPTHLTRKAVVYIRQSTPHQVVSNQESLRLQYALRERTHELGWHEADIDVIDADLGLSGASAAGRSGFKELVGRVSLREVGLILSIDVTRLARNCSDWYPLPDICGLRGCLIADRAVDLRDQAGARVQSQLWLRSRRRRQFQRLSTIEPVRQP
jgi:DNA invertase Pin-like site-specific DNA recombinase